jgi:linearmycin/streptolysin S transport system permease protein
MDTFYKTLAVALKDIQVFLKDRAAALTMILLPVVIGAFTAAMNSGGEGGIHLPVVVVNQDSGAYGESIVKVLSGIAEVELTSLDSPTTAEQQVATGEALAAIVIPIDLSRSIEAHEPIDVTVILDPTQEKFARIIATMVDEIANALAIQGEIRYGIKTVLADMGYSAATNPDLTRAAQAQVEGVLFTQLQRMETDAPIKVVKETLTGENVLVWNNVISLVLPGFGVMFAFFVVPVLAVTLLREKSDGTLRRLLAAPLPRSSLIGGKVLGYVLVVVVQITILFTIGAIFMDMPLGTSPLGMALVTVALGLCATTLGMLVATISRSTGQAEAIGMLIIFGLGFLSGSMSPVDPPYRGEGLMATITSFFPQSQTQMAYQTLMLQNGDVAAVLPNVLYLLGLSLVFFLIAVWRFRTD